MKRASETPSSEQLPPPLRRQEELPNPESLEGIGAGVQFIPGTRNFQTQPPDVNCPSAAGIMQIPMCVAVNEDDAFARCHMENRTDCADRLPVDLVFGLDVSASMRAGSTGKTGIEALVETLEKLPAYLAKNAREGDTIAFFYFASRCSWDITQIRVNEYQTTIEQCLDEATGATYRNRHSFPAKRCEEICGTVASLLRRVLLLKTNKDHIPPGGGTNLHAAMHFGLLAAGTLARRHQAPEHDGQLGRVGRFVLCTDGSPTVGPETAYGIRGAMRMHRPVLPVQCDIIMMGEGANQALMLKVLNNEGSLAYAETGNFDEAFNNTLGMTLGSNDDFVVSVAAHWKILSKSNRLVGYKDEWEISTHCFGHLAIDNVAREFTIVRPVPPPEYNADPKKFLYENNMCLEIFVAYGPGMGDVVNKAPDAYPPEIKEMPKRFDWLKTQKGVKVESFEIPVTTPSAEEPPFPSDENKPADDSLYVKLKKLNDAVLEERLSMANARSLEEVEKISTGASQRFRSLSGGATASQRMCSASTAAQTMRREATSDAFSPGHYGAAVYSQTPRQ